MAAPNFVKNSTITTENEVITNRIVDAPRELVYKVWTTPEHIAKWWGPAGFTNTVHEMDVREGGIFRYTMHGADGVDFPNRISYSKVVPPERLEFKLSDDIDNDPNAYDVVVTFEALGDKTSINIHMTSPNAEQLAIAIKEYGAVEGQKQNLDKMEQYLNDMDFEGKAFTINRQFDAPRDLVYKVWSNPEHLAKWWGPIGFEINISQFEFKPGGIFHYSMTAANGAQMWGKFTYRDMQAPEMIIFVNAFSDKDGNTVRTDMVPNWPLEILNKATFVERNGKTILTLKGYPINATETECKTYDAFHANMQQGFKGTFDQLDTYLATVS